MGNVIQVHNLVRSFQDGNLKTTALDDINFDLPEGESMAIVGTSGSGKTTMLHILGGLDKPTTGEVTINGELLNKMSDDQLSKFRNKTIGFVFQFFYLQDYLTAAENVALPLILANESRKSALEKARELLVQVGLEHRLNHYPKQISGGETQRIAVARALINNPKILLADEPTGNLDKENAEKILDTFDQIAKTGVSVVVITHDGWISKKFQNVLTLDKGKVKNEKIAMKNE